MEEAAVAAGGRVTMANLARAGMTSLAREAGAISLVRVLGRTSLARALGTTPLFHHCHHPREMTTTSVMWGRGLPGASGDRLHPWRSACPSIKPPVQAVLS
jgi:hypothetical protein